MLNSQQNPSDRPLESSFPNGMKYRGKTKSRLVSHWGTSPLKRSPATLGFCCCLLLQCLERRWFRQLSGTWTFLQNYDGHNPATCYQHWSMPILSFHQGQFGGQHVSCYACLGHQSTILYCWLWLCSNHLKKKASRK